MITLGEVAVIGGGCYGGFYLEQLRRAGVAEAMRWDALLVIDRDPACAAANRIPGVPAARLVTTEWGEFLDGWLDPATRRDADRIVPSPLMPHLMSEWLLRRCRERWPAGRVERVPAEAPFGTPFDRLHPGDGVRYLSHADWTCPIHCIEPARCPAIHAPRSWEMTDTVDAWAGARRAERPTAAPVFFACRHASHGVGMHPVTQAFAALDDLAAVVTRHGRGDLIVGSVSACHGAVALLRVEAT